MNDQPGSPPKAPMVPQVISPRRRSSAIQSADAAGVQAWAGRVVIGLRAMDRGAPREWLNALRKVPIVLTSFFVGVLIPSIAVILYFVFLASDQYVAEARLSVRAASIDRAQDQTAAGAISNLALGATPQLAGQDAHIVAEYLRSRAAVEDIGKKIDLVSVYRRPGTDFWWRLKDKPKAEELQKYWASMISTSVDGSSGIVTIMVRAFRPEDARALAEACVEVSEALVNVLSERARRDAFRKAEDEVRRTEGMLRDALNGLRAFRDKEGFIDPALAANSTSQLLMGALAERVRMQSDMFVMARALAPNAPTVKALKDRIDGIDAQIEQLRSELTSKSEQARTVSSAIVRFEELELQRGFAEKLYELAQNGLERARTRADRQQIYLAVFVPPFLPEEAKYPERLLMSFIIPMMLVVLWSIFALTAAAIEDHLK